jgi:hypothetical protein
MRIDQHQPNAAVRRVLASQVVRVISGQSIGAQTRELNYKAQEFVYRHKKEEDCIRAIVEFLEKDHHRVHHVRRSLQYVRDFVDLPVSAGEPT